MANKIYDEIKKRISDYPDGTVFFTSDFLVPFPHSSQIPKERSESALTYQR